jgi:hypothetical protein
MLNPVLRQISSVLIVGLTVCLAACRQADGPMPEAIESIANELGDITRDLQNVAYRKPTRVEDLTDDISH